MWSLPASPTEFLVKHWRMCLIAGLCVLNIATANGWAHSHDMFVREHTVHEQDISNFRQAQTEANTRAQQLKQTIQQEAKANADQADARYSTLLAEYRANLLRYKANQSGASSTNHSELQAAQSGDGPSEGSIISSIVISGDDAQICAVNTARLQAVHDWALNPPKDGIQ